LIPQARTVEQRLRRFLLIFSACTCLGTVLELWFAKHTDGLVQLIPFGLAAVGLLAILAALLRPGRLTLLLLRVVMVVLIAGSLYGVVRHVQGNIELKLEFRPNASVGDVWFEALRGGNPILAPGVLAMTGILALAATYRHPALEAG
jgi:hypothetical protein